MNEETRESNPARKRFTNEVTEEPLQDNAMVKRKVMENIRKENEMAQSGGGAGNDNGNENEGSKNDAPQTSQNTYDYGAEKGEGEANEKVKDGRGRHKKGCLCEKCVAKRSSGQPDNKGFANNGSEKLDSATNAYRKVSAPVGAPPVNNDPKKDYVDLSQYISGALFLIALDSVMPALITTIMGVFDKKYKRADKSKLKLTATEKKELEPLADQVVKVLFGMVHPAIAFGITVSLMYMGKVLSLEDEDFKPEVVKEPKGEVRKSSDKLKK